MFVSSPKALAMAGMALAVALAPPALGQSNPFIPSSAPSKAQVERMMEDKFKAMEARLIAANKEASEKRADPQLPPGVPGAYDSGANVPGGMTPPGALPPGVAGPSSVPGGNPIGDVEPPKGQVEAARDNGVRFIGCINGVPKFTRQSGERVTFTKAEIATAVKEGILPACR